MTRVIEAGALGYRLDGNVGIVEQDFGGLHSNPLSEFGDG
jgi:hypothetical protein